MNLVSLKSPGIVGRALCLAIAVALLLPSAPANANSAQDMFADGNRVFRDDLYWAALLRYRQAAEAGMQSPLLDYNMGVAHYKAGQHQRARTHLRHAARSPKRERSANEHPGRTIPPPPRNYQRALARFSVGLPATVRPAGLRLDRTSVESAAVRLIPIAVAPSSDESPSAPR